MFIRVTLAALSFFFAQHVVAEPAYYLTAPVKASNSGFVPPPIVEVPVGPKLSTESRLSLSNAMLGAPNPRQSFMMTNTGTDVVNIVAWWTNDYGFLNLTHDCREIAAGASCPGYIDLSPSTLGDFQGSIRIYYVGLDGVIIHEIPYTARVVAP